MVWSPVSRRRKGGKVLIWLTNAVLGSTTYNDLKALHQAQGATVHTNSDWSNTLSDYKLIYWPTAVSNPSWWGQITGDTWVGRLVITAEFNGFPWEPSVAYVAGLAGLIGITLSGADEDTTPGADGPVEIDALTSGLSTLKLIDTSLVSGGTTLCRTVQSGSPWLARNKPGTNVNFVVSGDCTFMNDNFSAVTPNTKFFQNCFTVAP